MLRYRLSEAAQGDVLEVLAWTHERFGQVARLRYENLSVAALRDIASQLDRPGIFVRPELGSGARRERSGAARSPVNKGEPASPSALLQ